MLAACALTCSPTVCPAAGLLVSPGRGGTGVGCRWSVPSSLLLWPVYVVVDAPSARKAMTQDLRDLGMIVTPRMHDGVIRRVWVCRAACLGDASGGGGERLGRPGPAPTWWMALCPLAVGYLVSWVLRLVGPAAPCRRRLAP